jgi:hypothetical protein
MLIEPANLVNAKVVTEKGDTLGTVANIIFSTDATEQSWFFGEARMLVFPDLTSPVWKDAFNALKGVVGTAIEKELPGSAGEIASKGLKEGTGVLEKQQERTEAEKLGMFYLFPISGIKAGEKIVLNKELDIKTCVFIDKDLGTDKLKAFYHADAPKDGRLWTNTLNLVHVQGLIVTDSERKKGRIDRIQLDPEGYGKVASLLIRTRDEGTIVAVKFDDFNFKILRCKTAFKNSS